jgi:hypothetical protein
MLGLHLLCRDRLNLTRGGQPDTWESGFWDVSPADASTLVGGMLYLHQSKGDRSYFGGRISSFREVDTDHVKKARIVFAFTFDAKARGASWQGAKHGIAVKSGVVNEE